MVGNEKGEGDVGKEKDEPFESSELEGAWVAIGKAWVSLKETGELIVAMGGSSNEKGEEKGELLNTLVGNLLPSGEPGVGNLLSTTPSFLLSASVFSSSGSAKGLLAKESGILKEGASECVVPKVGLVGKVLFISSPPSSSPPPVSSFSSLLSSSGSANGLLANESGILKEGASVVPKVGLEGKLSLISSPPIGAAASSDFSAKGLEEKEVGMLKEKVSEEVPKDGLEGKVLFISNPSLLSSLLSLEVPKGRVVNESEKVKEGESVVPKEGLEGKVLLMSNPPLLLSSLVSPEDPKEGAVNVSERLKEGESVVPKEGLRGKVLLMSSPSPFSNVKAAMGLLLS